MNMFTTFYTDSQHCSKCPKYHWSTDQRDSCIIMEEEYIKFPQLLAMTLLAFVSVGCIFTGIVTFIILPNHVLHTIDLDNNTVDVLLLLSLMGCFCSSVTFIGRPTKLTCTARESLACIWLTLVMKCILHKIFQSVSHSQGKHLNCFLKMNHSFFSLSLEIYRIVVSRRSKMIQGRRFTD